MTDMDAPTTHSGSIVEQLAKYLYDSLAGDLDSNEPAYDLLAYMGYTDENGEWIYDDD